MIKPSTSYLSLAVLIAAPVFAHHNMSALFDFNQRFTEKGSLADGRIISACPQNC